MTHDPDREPLRYYIDDEPNGPGYVICDHERNDSIFGTPLTTWAAAVEVCQQLNTKGRIL